MGAIYYSEERVAYECLTEGLDGGEVRYTDSGLYRMEERAFRATFDKGEKETPVYTTTKELDALDEYLYKEELLENEFGVLEDVVIVEKPKEFPSLDF